MTAKDVLAKAHDTNALKYFCDADSCECTDKDVY